MHPSKLPIAILSLCIITACSSPETSTTDPTDPIGPQPDAGLADASSPDDAHHHHHHDADRPDVAYPDIEPVDEEAYAIRCEPQEPLPDGTLPTLEEAPTPHHHDDDRIVEHEGLMNLVPYEGTTHVAMGTGYWCNPTTWHNGEIPGAGARVVIHEDAQIIYDMTSDEALFTVRVDGVLEFSPRESSTMVVDTIVVDPRGTLHMGREARPVSPDVEIRVLFADNGDIDTSWDPMLLSRGLVAHGATRIHGEPRTTHLKVSVDPMAGDEELRLASVPLSWRPGDTLVLAGTRYSGWKWDNDIRDVRYHGTQDEVLTITAIEGDRVEFEPALVYDHASPRADLKTSVAHFSRNVSFENQGGPDTPTHQRGHVMFMHSDNVDVRFAAFWNLGRTDKSREARDVETLDAVESDTNIQGRYSFHFHRTGVTNQRNPAISIGNTVFHSPGWGFVHHDSHAHFDANASFDTFGAGFVAEMGNETGAWTNNIAIRAEGNRAFNPKNGVDIDIFDIARTGSGFWFQGRLVRSVNNIAASVNQGFAYFHRGRAMFRVDAQYAPFPESLGLDPRALANHPPILEFHGNESFASDSGVFVVKANPNQGHDIRSWMSDFTAWEVVVGAYLEYTSHYTLENFDVIGLTQEPFRRANRGINFGNNTSDMVILNARIEGFKQGIRLGKHFTSEVPPEANTYVVVAPTFINVETEYEDLTDVDRILTAADIDATRFELNLDNAESLLYRAANDEGGRRIPFRGEKIDSIGPIPIPAGTDNIEISLPEMVRILEQQGYYRDANDIPYVIAEQYFSDRTTGTIHKFGIPVRLAEDVALHNQYFSYRDAVFIGPIDFSNQPPIAQNVAITTPKERSISIDVLANDTDPEGDTLEVRGFSPPRHGEVWLEADGTLTYKPDLRFTGEDRFVYWAHDGQGNFSPAEVVVTVGP